MSNYIERFVTELTDHITSTAIVTVAATETVQVDIARNDDGTFQYGHPPDESEAVEAWFKTKLAPGMRECIAVILRSFTNTSHENGLPVKQVRAWLFMEGEAHRLPPSSVREAFGTDHVTGKPLTLEEAVEYH